MKRSWIVSIAGLLVSALAVVPAQADIKIGVVNASRLLQESPQAKAVQEALRSEFAPKQRELAAQQAALKAKQEKYEKDAPTMSADQRAKAEKEIRDGNREYSQKATDFQEDANTRQNEELSRLQSRHRRRSAELRDLPEVRPGADRGRGLRQQLARHHRRRCWPGLQAHATLPGGAQAGSAAADQVSGGAWARPSGCTDGPAAQRACGALWL